jgi:uncharacterized phage protein gp47/JayE
MGFLPSFIRLLPLFTETVDSIRARLNADANAGLTPEDDAFLDTTPGGLFWDLTQAPALEVERVWDALSVDMISASFPATAWATYLDEHGLTLGLYRKQPTEATGVVTFEGDSGSLIATGTRLATEQSDPDADPITFITTSSANIDAGGSTDVPVQAVLVGSAGNVAIGAISVVISPSAGISSVANALPVTGGSDLETDEAFRERILLAYRGSHGPGTVDDYKAWALAYRGVGFVTVNPLWMGPGTVQVVVTDDDNNPVSPQKVAELQAGLDPTLQEGRGQAPIGALVTVATPNTVVVDVTASVLFEEGYSLEGADGTIAARSDLDTVIREYVDGLPPGEDVVIQHVVGRIFLVAGVYDVLSVTLNGLSVNLTIAALEVAVTGNVVLS